MKSFSIVSFVIVSILAAPGMGTAQTFDAEPNDTCLTTQVVGSLIVPHTVAGSLDTPPGVPDIDFFQFTGTPGQRLQAHMRGEPSGAGTLHDPFLGLFDSSCELVDLNDDFTSLESRLDFMIPADGIFVLAASSCCDHEFAGVGGSSGTYEMTVDLPPPPIGSISGMVIDAVTGAPLPGNQPPFASVELIRCDGNVCDEFVAFEIVDDQGAFTFDASSAFQTLDAGTYQIVAEAQNYRPATTDPFDVAPGAKIDIGVIEVDPPPISFMSPTVCSDLPGDGGLCSYSVDVRNNTGERLRISGWSVVDGFGLGSPHNRTLFEAGRRRLRIPPLKTRTLKFRFRVPRDVEEGAFFCADVYVGQEPNGEFHTLDSETLFCLSKQGASITVLSEKEVRAKMESLGISGPQTHPRPPEIQQK